MQNSALNRSIYSGKFNYPFGMVMPDRSGGYSGTYRYGFQGQERDDEIKGNGNHINFKYRMHDPRLGRFFSRDPLAYTYAYNSPYTFQENKLGLGTELEGLELNPWGEISTADYLNESIVGIGFGLGEGVYAGGESLVGGIYTLVTDFPSVYNGIKYAVSNPTETYEAVKTSLLETAAKLETGTNREKAQVVGEGIFIAAETIFGTKGATKLLKTSKLKVPKTAPLSQLKTTVLGKFPDYLNAANKLGANRFNIPSNIWAKMTPTEQWAANVKFLDRAIARGDNFLLSNPVKNIDDATGAFRKELDYLIDKGYKLSDDGAELIK